MRYRLRTVAYAFALIAAAMAVAGAFFGAVVAALVLTYWKWLYRVPLDKPLKGPAIFGAVTAVAVTVSGSVLLLSVCSTLENLPVHNSKYHCLDNAGELVAALTAYRKKHGEFPPVITYDDVGQPQQSWRTLVLPHLPSVQRRSAIGVAYESSERWDSPSNLQAAAVCPDEFSCTSAQQDPAQQTTRTQYFRIHANDDPTRDAFAWPILIEVAGREVKWTEPADISLDEAVQLLTTSDDSGHRELYKGYFANSLRSPPERALACCPAGSDEPQRFPIMVGQFDDPADAIALLAALPDGAQAREILQRERKRRFAVTWLWRRYYGVCALAVIAFLPGVALWRQRRNGQGAQQAREAVDEPPAC